MGILQLHPMSASVYNVHVFILQVHGLRVILLSDVWQAVVDEAMVAHLSI